MPAFRSLGACRARPEPAPAVAPRVSAITDPNGGSARLRSAFNPDDFEKFEQLAKNSAFSPALELLKKSVKKHGISA